MKMATYVQWDTMMYETFFAEEPRATGWIQCDQVGPAHHDRVWVSAIVPVSALLLESGIHRLSEEGRCAMR